MPDELIYLDNHSTTRCDPRVADAMLPFLLDSYGNPHSSTHAAGHAAAAAIDEALRQIAEHLGGAKEEWIITSGATESTNLALLGHCLHPRNRKRHIVTAVTEHPAVLDPIEMLRREGFRVTVLGVDANGQIDEGQFADTLTDDTGIVSLMLANNEIGSLHPLKPLIEIAHQRDIPVHTDATQAVGRVAIDVADLKVDLLSCSAHKFYGPKGVGLLYCRRQGRLTRIQPRLFGGGQQRRVRPGTMNPAAIAGMATALHLCTEGLSAENQRIATLRQRLWEGLVQRIPGLEINGPALDSQSRVAGNLNVMFPGVEGEALMLASPQLAVSSGSACNSLDAVASHVLLGIGRSEPQARSSLRIGIGRFNTVDEIDRAITMLADAYEQMRRFG
ncbi:Cysteine desulfurase [Rosistilla carotiformis]|uniref:cysteine desulfurase n=1 Tax=Rosistilla carotiformis TaxID=2528017 RepID=A0A518JRD0_9BACT|nr:cysteine desulfurase family protein [Rosistilla carotiformis]QDV68107.1 Cysteine desulfurase [Rosistilla carotiformis]